MIRHYSQGRPTLIFCASRAGAEAAALQVQKDSNGYFLRGHEAELASFSSRVSDPNLAQLMRTGIGYHNAGAEYKDRRVVEEAFLSGHLSVLCSTSTLSQGVNLPAFCVVIKGTSSYIPGTGYQEYSEMLLTQMMGRAGRPQFDTEGVSVIMTSQSNQSQVRK